jgi:hypothetical protein
VSVDVGAEGDEVAVFSVRREHISD